MPHSARLALGTWLPFFCKLPSAPSTMNTTIPAAICQSMWQWKAQTPGLFALNCMFNQPGVIPPSGDGCTTTVSRCEGGGAFVGGSNPELHFTASARNV